MDFRGKGVMRAVTDGAPGKDGGMPGSRRFRAASHVNRDATESREGKEEAADQQPPCWQMSGADASGVVGFHGRERRCFVGGRGWPASIIRGGSRRALLALLCASCVSFARLIVTFNSDSHVLKMRFGLARRPGFGVASGRPVSVMLRRP